MKYVFALGLVVMIVLSFVAWRIKPDTDDRGRTRLVWATDDSPARREQVGLFEKLHPDIMLTTDPGNFLIEKMIVQSLAGLGPDLFDATGVYVLERLVESGVAMDLTDLARENGFDETKTWPGAIGNIKLFGKQYAFPGNVYSNVIIYNKNVFDKYGEPYPPREMSWQEFVEIGRRLTKREANGRGYECFGAMNLYWYELILQAGGRLYSPDGARCVLDSPEAIEGIEFYRDLMFKYHLMPTPQEQSSISGQGDFGLDAIGWFARGKVAMIRMNKLGLMKLEQYPELKGKVGFCHQPYYRKKVSLISSRLIGINRKSKHLPQAIQFMKFLTSAEYNRKISRLNDGLPPVPQFVRTATRPANHSTEDIFAESLERSIAPEVSPLVSPMVALDLIIRQLDLVTNNLKTPRQGCRDMTRAVNQAIFRNLCQYEQYRQRYEQIAGKPFDKNDPEWRDFSSIDER
jgi:multiple sugar transport system substrate-binding protein